MEERSLEELWLEYEKLATSVGHGKGVCISNKSEYIKKNMPRQDSISDRSQISKLRSKRNRAGKKSKEELKASLMRSYALEGMEEIEELTEIPVDKIVVEKPEKHRDDKSKEKSLRTIEAGRKGKREMKEYFHKLNTGAFDDKGHEM